MVQATHVQTYRLLTCSSPVSGATDIRSFVSFCVYILQNPDEKFYIGHTDNLQARSEERRVGKECICKFTRKNGKWNLVWSEQQASRRAAASREKEIKRMKSAKSIREVLLNGTGHSRSDLPSADMFESCLWSH